MIFDENFVYIFSTFLTQFFIELMLSFSFFFFLVQSTSLKCHVYMVFQVLQSSVLNLCMDMGLSYNLMIDNLTHTVHFHT